jgi:hypothetical protein
MTLDHTDLTVLLEFKDEMDSKELRPNATGSLFEFRPRRRLSSSRESSSGFFSRPSPLARPSL